MTTSPNQVGNQPAQAAAPMSLDEARKMLWPFRPFRGRAMGTLIETKQLSLKDLVYAIENAWDKRVRYAATTLMLERLNQVIREPEQPAGFLHVVSGGRSYSRRRQYLYTYLEGLLLGMFFGGSVILGIQVLTSRPSPTSSPNLSELLASPTGIIGLAIALSLAIGIPAFALFSVDKITSRLDKEIDNHRKGEEGEDRVMATISQILDGNWFAFRNILLPGRKGGDLDVVLVGPSAVLVLEIKHYTREQRNIGEHWEYGAGNRWKPLRSNPSRQAKNNAARLGNFLRADGIQQWVTPVVVWANPECPLTVENPAVAVWTLDRLPDALGNMWQDGGLAEEKRQQIVDKLTKLCERQKEASQTGKSR